MRENARELQRNCRIKCGGGWDDEDDGDNGSGSGTDSEQGHVLKPVVNSLSEHLGYVVSWQKQPNPLVNLTNDKMSIK